MASGTAVDAGGQAVTISASGKDADGKTLISLSFGGEVQWADKIDPGIASERTRVIDGIMREFPDLDRGKITRLLCRKVDAATKKHKDPSQVDTLLQIATEADLFCDPEGTKFAQFPTEGHTETWPVNSEGFKDWLRDRFFSERQKGVSSQAMADAIATIGARAVACREVHKTAIRVGRTSTAVYIDLCDKAWRCVEITKDGWRVLDKSPIYFVRKKGMDRLPDPQPGGDAQTLRQFVNVASDDDFILACAWLLGCCFPGVPCPLFYISGEQGSSKSTLAKMLRSLVDPNLASSRQVPKDERDLMILATNSAIVSFDNISHLSADTSDLFCSIVTGGAMGVRKLYTDDSEQLFVAMRPMVINGIENAIVRPDLLDRTIAIHLQSIPQDSRRRESEIWDAFSRHTPFILGWLCDMVAVAIARMDQVKLPGLPRMADFCQIVSAAEQAFGWPSGKFIEIFEANQTESSASILEDCLLTKPLMDLLANGPWTGTRAELLRALEGLAEGVTVKSKWWPTSARQLGSQLKRITPNLRSIGVQVAEGLRTSKGATLLLSREDIG